MESSRGGISECETIAQFFSEKIVSEYTNNTRAQSSSNSKDKSAYLSTISIADVAINIMRLTGTINHQNLTHQKPLPV